MKYRCMICGSGRLEKLDSTKREVFVTGDRKAFRQEGRMISKVICRDCGLVQFLQNSDYVCAAEKVFKEYDVIHDKDFQAVKDGKKYCSKLNRICKRIREAIPLSAQGYMLDIGCGSGEFLEWFNQYYPEWNLYGFDIGKQFKAEVMNKKNVRYFFDTLDKLQDSGLKFDFISINHTLSLVDNVSDILNAVYELLEDDGIFFILDSDFEVHPYLLYEIEAHSFFTKEYLKSAVERYYFNVMDVKFEYEEKEIVVFAKKAACKQKLYPNLYNQNKKIYKEKVNYLNRAIDIVKEHLEKNFSIGIFGTSIAGVWLSEIITDIILESNNDKEVFYVEEDEDMLKKGIGVNGYPIHRLEEIVKSSIIFLPFPHYISESIMKRCADKYEHLNFISFD